MSDESRTIIIRNIKMPKSRSFDPMAKIWSSIRKRIKENYGFGVIGIFLYDEDEQSLSCNFEANCANLELDEARRLIYRFSQNWSEISALFVSIINDFIKSDCYDQYLKLIEKGEDNAEVYKNLFNVYLKSINLRTEKDEAAAAEKAMRFAKALGTVSELKSFQGL